MERIRQMVLDSFHTSTIYQAKDYKREVVYLIIATILVYSFCLSLYRLTLHPLAKIPGPRLAALTSWYEIYYDVWLGGQYFREIARMHQKYGPVVRMSPDEVHFNDSDFIDVLYPGGAGRKTNKPLMVGNRTGTPNSMVATADHDMHRRRRNALNSFFSAASVRKLEPIIREQTRKVLGRLEEASKSGEVMALHPLFKAYTSDVIVQYSFGECFNFVDDPEYGKPYFEACDMFFALNHAFAHWPWFSALVQSAPGWVMKNFGPALREMWEKKLWWIQKVREIRNSDDPDRVKKTIFGGVLNSNLPAEEKADIRLASETQLVIFAGEGTVAHTLSAAIYELLANPTTLQKVKSELANANPDPDEIPSFAQLDGLEYFNAVIQEVIRLHPGVINRQWRCSSEPLKYHDEQRRKEYVIPPGVTYSMTPTLLHKTPEVFENPDDFRPERWIGNPKLSRAFMGFSRGTRGCIGMNLARREMSIMLGTLLRRYDLYQGQNGRTLEIYDTKRERDIDANSEFIIPVPAKGSKGLRVMVRH